MAEATGLKCDVLKTHVAAEKHTVKMFIGTGAPTDVELFSRTLDLCPKAVDRAMNFLDRATTPPPKTTEKPKQEPERTPPDAS